MLKIIFLKKYIILIYFLTKNIFKNNHCHNFKHPLNHLISDRVFHHFQVKPHENLYYQKKKKKHLVIAIHASSLHCKKKKQQPAPLPTSTPRTIPQESKKTFEEETLLAGPIDASNFKTASLSRLLTCSNIG
jgi:hypothetical protein